jgi:hypothetical protein
MDRDFVVVRQLVLSLTPQIRLLYVDVCFCYQLSSDASLPKHPCFSLTFTSIWLVQDFHPLANDHTRHTDKGQNAIKIRK